MIGGLAEAGSSWPAPDRGLMGSQCWYECGDCIVTWFLPTLQPNLSLGLGCPQPGSRPQNTLPWGQATSLSVPVTICSRDEQMGTPCCLSPEPVAFFFPALAGLRIGLVRAVLMERGLPGGMGFVRSTGHRGKGRRLTAAGPAVLCWSRWRRSYGLRRLGSWPTS